MPQLLWVYSSLWNALIFTTEQNAYVNGEVLSVLML